MSTTGKEIISKWFDELKGWGGDPACIELGKRFDAELQQAQAALAARTKDYYDVADAVCKESTGAEDVCRQARELRAALAAVTLERDEAKGAVILKGAACAALREDRKELRAQLDAAHAERDAAVGLISAQLAACQSREAKALEELQLCQIQKEIAQDSMVHWRKLHGERADELAKAEADRDQLQAQVGALRGACQAALGERVNRSGYSDDSEPVLSSRTIQLINAALTMPAPAAQSIPVAQNFETQLQVARIIVERDAPAAPDSATDTKRLDHLLSYGLRGMKSDGKGGTFYTYPKNRADIDAAMSSAKDGQ